MARNKVFRVRLTEQELEKLERNAQERGVSSAELIRDYITHVAELGDFGGIEPHSVALRGPCIPTLNGLPLQRGTYSPSNSPLI